MFILPVDKILPPEPTHPGKPDQVRNWNLTVNIEPGVFKNETEWCPGHAHPHWNDYDIVIKIWFGDQCLLETALDQKQIIFSKNLPDTTVPTRKNLIVELSGKPDDASLEQDHHVCVKLDVTIEGLPMIPLFERHGFYEINSTKEKKIAGQFLGENGRQILEIYTPIYVWLLQHF